jgi:hypothetical protein
MKSHQERPLLPIPVRVNIYIEPDGSVTFADLFADILPVAIRLNSEDSWFMQKSERACDLCG